MAQEDEQLLTLFENHEDMTLARAQAIMKRRNLDISKATICNRLHEAGFKATFPLSKPLLTSEHIRRRLEWCELMESIDWNKVIFSDETTFWLKPTKRRYWTRGSTRKVVRVVKHPQKIHVWGCFCSEGFGKLFIFKQNLSAQLMVKIYKNALIPSMKKFSFDKDSGWQFQEDNDPKHTSKLAKNWKSENNIPKIPWPSNSPDLSPIENLWGIMKVKVAEHQPKTLTALITIIRRTWKNFSIDLAQALIQSMKQRIEACRMAKGDYTLY